MSERKIGERTIQMDWICPYCRQRNPGLAGTEGESLVCHTCGARKAGTVEYLMPDDTYAAPSITDPVLMARAKAGPNWICRHCKKDVRADRMTCSHCGAPRFETQQTTSEPHVETETRPTTTGFAANLPVIHTTPTPHVETASSAPVEVLEPLPLRSLPPLIDDQAFEEIEKAIRRKTFPSIEKAGLIFGGILVAGLLAWLLVWLFTWHETVAQVMDIHWQYTETLRERTLRHDEDWQDEMHSGAFNVSCESRERRKENCHPHPCDCEYIRYECNCTGGGSYDCNCRTEERCSANGNGSATCSNYEVCSTCTRPHSCQTCSRQECRTCYDQCPVYDQWCSYDWHDWPVIDQRTTEGRDTRVHWPGLTARPETQRLERAESYDVRFQNRNDTWTYHPSSLQAFCSYPVGSQWKAKYNRAGLFRPLQCLQSCDH